MASFADVAVTRNVFRCDERKRHDGA